MVGAIADWFAVTALFRHPLGLPVPHTALIPHAQGRARPEPARSSWARTSCRRRHPRAGRRGRRRAAGRPVAGGRGPHARRVVDEVADRDRDRRCAVRDDEVASLVAEALLPRLVEEPISAGRRHGCSRRSSRDGAHHGLVDLALDEAAPLAGRRNQRHLRRGAGGAGALVGAAAAQRRGDDRRPPRGRGLGRRHPRRPATTRPARRSTTCSSQLGRRPAGRPRDPGARRGAQGPACSSTRRSVDTVIVAVERGPHRAAGGARRGRTGRCAARRGRGLRAFGGRLQRDDELRAGSTRASATPSVFVVETLRRRARPP